MSSQDKHIDPWSITDVHRYLRGELSAREMHALEKAALDDPFLADALEGLATRESTPAALQQDLTELSTRLDKRVAGKKSRIFLLPWMRIAAAVILVAGLGVTAIITTSKHKADTARTAPLPSPAVNAAAASAAETVATKQDQLARAKEAPHQAAIASKLPANPKPAASPQSASDYNLAANQKPAEDYNPAADSEAGMQNIADSLKIVNRLAAAAITKPLLFAGQVRDINNRPVAGASLFLEGKNVATVTDNEGYFKLYVPPRDTIRKVHVDFAGYDETSVALNNDNRFGNIITLRARQASLQEVVVTGLGMKRKETMAAPPSDDPERLDSLWTKAAPTIGRAAYLDYLAAGKKDLGADSTSRGTVSISFDIDQKGQPSSFKIEQSLSPAQDAGLIRLVSEGPLWKLLRGKKARLLVSVSFP